MISPITLPLKINIIYYLARSLVLLRLIAPECFMSSSCEDSCSPISIVVTKDDRSSQLISNCGWKFVILE